MSADYDSGFGGGYHALESNGPGPLNWERSIIASLLAVPIVIFQFVTVLMTILGTVLSSTGLLKADEYGVFAQPGPIIAAGLAAWLVLRALRYGLTILFGGGAVARQKLYRLEHE